MLIAALIAFLAFSREIAILAVSFLAVGDSVAAIVGRKLGKRKLFGETLEGSSACFLSCVATGLVFYYAGLDIGLLTVLFGAIGATVGEILPIRINDNLIMPLLAGIGMTVIQL